MAQNLYRVKVTSFINNTLLQPGDEVVYDGEPGDNLEPISDSAKSRKSARDAQRQAAARGREFALRHPEAHVGTAAPGNSGMTHEQNAGLQAAGPDAGLTPEEVSALPAPEAKPRKGK